MTPLTISVHPEGHNPMFSECATHISIEGLPGSAFLVFKQRRDTDNSEVIINFDEFDVIIDAVKLLKSGMDEQDFD
jgi:hypothetical protein